VLSALWFGTVPYISVDAEPPVDPKDTLSAPFLVTNKNFWALHDTTLICGLNDVEFSTGKGITRLKVKQPPEESDLGTIEGRDSTHAFCDRVMAPTVPREHIELEVTLQFHYFWYLGRPMEDHFIFRTKRMSDGTLRFYKAARRREYPWALKLKQNLRIVDPT